MSSGNNIQPSAFERILHEDHTRYVVGEQAFPQARLIVQANQHPTGIAGQLEQCWVQIDAQRRVFGEALGGTVAAVQTQEATLLPSSKMLVMGDIGRNVVRFGQIAPGDERTIQVSVIDFRRDNYRDPLSRHSVRLPVDEEAAQGALEMRAHELSQTLNPEILPCYWTDLGT